MARLPFQMRAFTRQIPPASGELPVSLARLLWGAMTVGTTPISLGVPSRPLIELCWRAAMAAASVTEDDRGARWVKTASYNRLDPSEKSAVSYFLGMTQAKITCEMLLGVPHLVHLDAVLALLGRSTNASRPDFVGFDLASMRYTIAVEAKGRTNDRTSDVTARAKSQAGLLPRIINTTTSVRVASVASFDGNDHWHAYLEDPPEPDDMLPSLTIEMLLVAYYRPLVAALLAAGVNTDDSDETTSVARLPEIDLSLGVPQPIVSILSSAPLSGPVEADQLQTIGADLMGVLMETPGKSEAGNAPELWRSRGRAEAENPKQCTGLDGVRVILGQSWPQNRFTVGVQ
ncbi:hypothetical protein DMA12_43905 [Amycolatopsis balhimycina DSM 5908]|uniref:Uncharacterized protein n=1 Tax=Amycolatopsis balhimycina DSM 5908 TaxID=1081091 RepID=A0A428VXH7_AMYBA|nr:hypothetical protein [Amycolatopsis balhimycina]RSM35570.1 hypothetical protein DMA12_43905 [Amycolatopsis balhimycina DSM 5908]